MRTKKLIEKLEGLATFYALAAKDTDNLIAAAKQRGEVSSVSFHTGKKIAFELAFHNLDRVIKEIKNEG